jgi:predicted regulator of amino acid metabolism with ACT domain
MIKVRENVKYCGGVEVSRNGVIKETEVMEKTELTQTQEAVNISS